MYEYLSRQNLNVFEICLLQRLFVQSITSSELSGFCWFGEYLMDVLSALYVIMDSNTWVEPLLVASESILVWACLVTHVAWNVGAHNVD